MKTTSKLSAQGLVRIKGLLLLISLLATGGMVRAQDNVTAATGTETSAVEAGWPVNLKPYYNFQFFTEKRTNSPYKGMLGRRVFDGLPFAIDGRILMDGQNDSGLPEVSGIKVGRKFEELHLIHTAQWHEYEGCPIAILRLHYADGTSHDFEVKYAVQVTANRLPSEAREILTDPDSKLISRGPGPFKGDTRLIKTVFKNPCPAKKVETMDVISTHSRASYILVAATLANQDSQRAVTPPIPLNDPDYHFDGAVKIQVVDAESSAAITGADVYPYMSVDDVCLVVPPMLTSTAGAAVVEYPVSRVRSMGVRVSKDGYVGVSGHWQSDEIPSSITYQLKAKKKISGLLLDAAGKPVAGAKVLGAADGDYLQLDDMNIANQEQETKTFTTDAGGHFSVFLDADNFSVVAAAPPGFALVSSADLNTNHTITLQPWGRVEGTMLNHGKPLAERELVFSIDDGSMHRNILSRTPATVDAQGHFSFPHVPAGDVRILLKQPMGGRGWSSKEMQTVAVKPGETSRVEIILSGRDVTGRWKRGADLPADVNLEQGNFFLRPEMPPPPIPKDLDSPEKIQIWYQNWIKTAAGKKLIEAQRQVGQLQVKSDGTLHGEAIAQGKYTLTANFWGQAGQMAEVPGREVVIPENSADNSDAPFDLGEIVIQAVKNLKVGDTAPDFAVKTLDEQPLKLADFRGKYVLLDFWATWCGPCVAETPHMKAAYEAYGSDARFVMISLSLDQSARLPKKFAQNRDLKWIQGFLGDWSRDTVTKDYCVRGIPSIFLLGPDGKIIAMNLRGDAIKSAVGSALGKQP